MMPPALIATHAKHGKKEILYPADRMCVNTTLGSVSALDPMAALKQRCGYTKIQRAIFTGIRQGENFSRREYLDMVINEQALLSTIRDRYKSLQTPEFGFVAEVIGQQPYQQLVNALRIHFTITEETEPNDDVSFGYLLEREAKRWLLRISMVAPYAVLMRLETNNLTTLVNDYAGLQPEEILIRDALRQYNIEWLNRERLESRINLVLFNTDAENTRIYQALFSDTDVLPWH
jgi:DNA mismatch repair ATPase MutS